MGRVGIMLRHHATPVLVLLFALFGLGIGGHGEKLSKDGPEFTQVQARSGGAALPIEVVIDEPSSDIVVLECHEEVCTHALHDPVKSVLRNVRKDRVLPAHLFHPSTRPLCLIPISRPPHLPPLSPSPSPDLTLSLSLPAS